MADIDDRWYRTDRATGERVKTARHGAGKRWVARWRDTADMQRSRSFEKKADAERFLDQVRADLARGTYVDPNAGKITVRAYATRWLAAQTADPSTREAMELRFRLHVFPTLGDHPLGTLRPSTVQAWVHGLALAPNYARTVFANLSAVLSAAVDDGLIGRNPCGVRSVRPPSAVNARVEPWPAAWVAGVTGALPDRYAATVAPGAGCGLRQGEVFGLAVDDVDFLRGVVHVRRQVKIVGAKLVFGPPKRGKTRNVPLSDEVKVRLAEHLRQFPARVVTLPWLPTGKPVATRLVFASRESGAINRNYFNARVWKKALRAAGVPDSRENGFHSLRHYYASVLLADGVDIRALASYLGHADPGFTLRVYTHLMPEVGDRARRAVDRAFGRLSANGGAPDVRHDAR